VYLVVALSVPGAFLIAKQASVVSSSQFILPSEHSSEHSSSERFGGNAGEDGGQDSWTGPKRLRGALLSKVGIDKNIVISLTAPLLLPLLPGATTPMLEPDERKLVVGEKALPPKDKAFPQERLGRSPPSSRT
jgi:hypothetical protein